MQKLTFSFPSYDSMWLFKEQSKAINVRIEPKKNLMTGLFVKQEIDLALQQYKATTIQH